MKAEYNFIVYGTAFREQTQHAIVHSAHSLQITKAMFKGKDVIYEKFSSKTMHSFTKTMTHMD